MRVIPKLKNLEEVSLSASEPMSTEGKFFVSYF